MSACAGGKRLLPALAALGVIAGCDSMAPTMAPPPEQRHVTEDYFHKQLATLQDRVHHAAWSPWQPMGEWGHRVEYSTRSVPLDGIDLFCNHAGNLPYATFSLYPSVADGLTAQPNGDAVFSSQYGDESRSDPTKGTGVILHLPLECRLHTDKFLRQVQVRQSTQFSVRVLPGDGGSGIGGSCDGAANQCVEPNRANMITSQLVETPNEPIGLYAVRAYPAGGWAPAFQGHNEEPLASVFMRWDNRPGNIQQVSFLNQGAAPITFSYCIYHTGRPVADGCEKKPNGGTITVPAARAVSVRTAGYVNDPAVSVSIELPP